MFGGTFTACLLSAIGLRRPPPPPKVALAPRFKPRVRPIRAGADRKPAWGRLPVGSTLGPLPAAAVAPAPERAAADARLTEDRPSSRLRPVGEHVAALLACFRASDSWLPGEAVDSVTMQEIYAHVCRENGWREHKWQTFACALGRAMASGPRGGRKPYRKVERDDGTVKSERIYILPDWTADRQPAPRRRDADAQSTPHRRAA